MSSERQSQSTIPSATLTIPETRIAVGISVANDAV